MTDFHEEETEFSRLLREVPSDDAPGAGHRQILRERVLAEFDRQHSIAAAHPRWKHALTKGREIMRRPVPRLVAFTTACLAIAVLWMFIPGSQTAAQAFNRFAEAVVTAKTAKFQMEMNVEGQPKQTFQAYYLAPEKYRQELPGMVNISDFQAGKMVSIMPEQKKVMVMNLKGAPQNKLAKSHFAQLRELLAGARNAKEDKYERLGEKEIDGKKAVGFRYDSPADTVTLWGDPATGAPVRIESVWGGLPHTETVMSHFEINVELKESLFDTTPPEGYKVQSLDVDASATREEDLIKAFEACSDISGGEFPETLDTAGVTNLIIKYTAAKIKDKQDVSDEQMQELMKQSIAIGRGFQFVVTLPESADTHYAGKGVKRGTKDRPIFWYRPEGAKKYRVLYADLSILDADAAPRVEGARRIEKASKTSVTGAK
jgi:outer membrane lipoprotein-sorting protein